MEPSSIPIPSSVSRWTHGSYGKPAVSIVMSPGLPLQVTDVCSVANPRKEAQGAGRQYLIHRRFIPHPPDGMPSSPGAHFSNTDSLNPRVCSERCPRNLRAGGFSMYACISACISARRLTFLSVLLVCATWVAAQSGSAGAAPRTGAASQPTTQAPATTQAPGTVTPPARTATPPGSITTTPVPGSTPATPGTNQPSTANPQSGPCATTSGTAGSSTGSTTGSTMSSESNPGSPSPSTAETAGGSSSTSGTTGASRPCPAPPPNSTGPTTGTGSTS